MTNGQDSNARMDRAERLIERAGERLDAIAESVELLVGAQRESESRMAKLEENASKLEAHMVTLTETMGRLANIVIRHDERLDKLDGGDA